MTTAWATLGMDCCALWLDAHVFLFSFAFLRLRRGGGGHFEGLTIFCTHFAVKTTDDVNLCYALNLAGRATRAGRRKPV
jgi:hypothetical protein